MILRDKVMPSPFKTLPWPTSFFGLHYKQSEKMMGSIFKKYQTYTMKVNTLSTESLCHYHFNTVTFTGTYSKKLYNFKDASVAD